MVLISKKHILGINLVENLPASEMGSILAFIAPTLPVIIVPVNQIGISINHCTETDSITTHYLVCLKIIIKGLGGQHILDIRHIQAILGHYVNNIGRPINNKIQFQRQPINHQIKIV